MHLLQKYGPNAHGLGQQGAVGLDVAGLIAHMVAQVHAVPGRGGDPALPISHQGFDPRGGRPLWT
jgi:hypothetical protein